MQGVDEILNEKEKVVIGAMLIFVFGLIVVLNYCGYFENQERDQVLNDAFETTVVNKYVDMSNHMTPKVVLANGNEMVNFFPKNNIELILGDSLVKKKKSTDMLVFRGKKLVYSISLLDK